LTDRDLVAGLIAGDERAFEELYAQYGEGIQRHVARFVRSDAAQDLAQEVFLRAWQRAEQWDGRGTFKAWLYRIATNLALNHLRTVRRRREQPLYGGGAGGDIVDGDEEDVPAWVFDDAALGPGAAVEQSERLAQVRQLVDQLADNKRRLFRLVHEYEMSVRDAADQLGIPEGTAKSRLYYARKQLAQQWQDLEARWEDGEYV
jgi:RNA polymerase sigma-70 factor (ECF subfamily)